VRPTAHLCAGDGVVSSHPRFHMYFHRGAPWSTGRCPASSTRSMPLSSDAQWGVLCATLAALILLAAPRRRLRTQLVGSPSAFFSLLRRLAGCRPCRHGTLGRSNRPCMELAARCLLPEACPSSRGVSPAQRGKAMHVFRIYGNYAAIGPVHRRMAVEHPPALGNSSHLPLAAASSLYLSCCS